MKSITIRSRLTNNVNFPNLKQINVQNKPKFVTRKSNDGFVQFSEMYQWLKEIVNEAEVIVENVNKKFKIFFLGFHADIKTERTLR